MFCIHMRVFLCVVVFLFCLIQYTRFTSNATDKRSDFYSNENCRRSERESALYHWNEVYVCHTESLRKSSSFFACTHSLAHANSLSNGFHQNQSRKYWNCLVKLKKLSKIKSNSIEWWALASSYEYSGRQNGFSVWQYGMSVDWQWSKGKSFEHAPTIHSFISRILLQFELLIVIHTRA